MTDEIEGRADYFLRKIDEMGGMVRAIEQGYVQREIQDAAYAWQRQVEAKQKVVVGVNAFRSDDPPVTVMKVDPALEERQVAGLHAFRRERNGTAAKQAVEAVRAAAKGTDNLMPPILGGREGGGDARRDLRRAARRLRRVPGDGGTLAGR